MTGFNKLTNVEKMETYGGSGFFGPGGFNFNAIATMIQLAITTFTSVTSGVKLLTSQEGSIKSKNSETKWKESNSSAKSTRSNVRASNTKVYAF